MPRELLAHEKRDCIAGASTGHTAQTVPQVPWSHPFIERLIRTFRREYLDCLFFWTADDLVRKLELFKKFYNAARVH